MDECRTVLRGARIFDGKNASPIEGRDVLVVGALIKDLIPAGHAVEGAREIDCAGKFVMPGLIDAHWHAILAAAPLPVVMAGSVPYLYLLAAQEAERTLLRGFTTVRDLGGPTFALKRAIDEARFAGPRIYPSGGMLSQTSGHGDFRLPNELGPASHCAIPMAEAAGISVLADGVPAVLRGAREQLMQGASQIKIMAGGGVASAFDPIDTLQYTPDEMRAAVAAAADFGTYVCAHVYTAAGITRCLDNGVKSIEHGQLADEESMRRIADAGAFWSVQPFLNDEDANPLATEQQRRDSEAIAQGTVRAIELAKKHGVKTAFGTDILFSPAGTRTQGKQLTKFARWFDNADVLRLATSNAAELLALSGARDPYPAALGVIEGGALADVLVVDGDPLRDIGVLANSERHLQLIMKDGRIYKDAMTTGS
ncbi:MAG TPA: amidohydrolase family protein [Candidatus Tumulicola sp.]|nr:amidohydrolase family protein [Candidatus Tumulicola sp.]